jgi:hypothetical protein
MNRRFKWFLSSVVLIVALFAVAPTVGAAEVTLNWQPGTAPSAEITDSYVLYFKPLRDGLWSGMSSAVVDPAVACVDLDGDGLHDDCTFVWSTLPDGDRVHYFVATAINEAGESGYSNQVKKVYTPAETPRNLNNPNSNSGQNK